MPYNPRLCFGLPIIGFTFAELACRTWDELREADSVGMSLGEESITDYLLLALKKKHASDITIKKFTKKQEAGCGADWEWWFTNGTSWAGLRIHVQAKKIDAASKSYLALDPTGAQIQKLISVSQKTGVYPLLCFYNFWRGYPTQKHCSKNWYVYGWPHLSKKFWGCALAPARAVRGGKSNKLSDILNISIPWMCVFCQSRPVPAQSGPGPSPLPDRVHSLIKDFEKECKRDNEDMAGLELSQRPPDYVLKTETGYEINLEKYPIEDHPAGIAVIADEEA